MPTTTVTKTSSRTGLDYELEVVYEEAPLLRSADYFSPADYGEDEIISVEYQGIDVTDIVCGIYSTKELLN